MIQSTRKKRAAKALKGKYGKRFPGALVARLRALLTALDAARVPQDLRFPAGHQLEERAGQHSVWIGPHWRMRFVWTATGPGEVEIVEDRSRP